MRSLVVHEPNFNLDGMREPGIYCWDEVEELSTWFAKIE